MNKWYAVMTDRWDTDWGYGSYDLEEAKEMVQRNRNIYPHGYIAIIDEGADPICVGYITPTVANDWIMEDAIC